jgi:radical SAM protein with 4Fe4S-binding SPASM domain
VASLRQVLHPLYRSLETTVHPLRYLFLEITQKCNLNCLHCGSDCGRRPMENELSTAEWVEFIKRLAVHYPGKDKPFLVVTGGEPLLHDDLFTILSASCDAGFTFGMVTNGFALDTKTADRLVDHRMKSMTVSLDGLEKSHDRLRGRSGSFQRAERALRLMAKRPVPLLDVVTCVHPANLKELPEILKVIRETGVKRWRLFNIFPKGRAASNGELLLDDEQTMEMLDWIRRMRPKLKAEGFFLDYCCEGYLPKSLDREVRDEPYFCRAGIAIGSVLADGSISACPNISRKLIQGNIRRDDFFNVWDKKFDPFRDRRWMRKGACETCKDWRRCRGNSLHLWNDEKGTTERCYLSIAERLKKARG